MHLRTLLAAGALVAVLALGVVMSWRFITPTDLTLKRVVDFGPAAGFAAGSVTTFAIADDGSVVELPPRRRADVWATKIDGCPPDRLSATTIHLVRMADGSFVALSAASTHMGEFVRWVPDFEAYGRSGWFVESCHVDTYDYDGTRVFGPASRNLDRYQVTVKGDRVEVDLRRLTRGAAEAGRTRAGTTYGPAVPDSTATPAATVAAP